MKRLGTIVLILLVMGFGIAGYRYISYRTKNAVSDAAFVRTDSLLTLSFKVEGKIDRLTKKEGEYVHKGELLAHIDTKDFEVARARTQKRIEALSHEAKALQLHRQELNQSLDIQAAIVQNDKKKLKGQIEAFGLGIEAKGVQLTQLKRDLARYQKLYRRHLIQKEKLEKAQTAKEVLERRIASDRKRLEAMRVDLANLTQKLHLLQTQKQKVEELGERLKATQKQIAALQKAKEELQNKIAYASLYAPIEGRVAKRFVNVDQVVKKGSPIYSVVDPKDLHIEVLLSEKKLKGVKPGNEVKIHIDAYPDRIYHGRVEWILPASAATFALVPRDIASGEFTKLDQRFGVRITIEDPTPDLRVGMGAGVAIERK